VIALFAAPSFQDGRGSVWADAWPQASSNKTAASTILFIIVRFIKIPLSPSSFAYFAPLRESSEVIFYRAKTPSMQSDRAELLSSKRSRGI
jgi:hypothetical protein